MIRVDSTMRARAMVLTAPAINGRCTLATAGFVFVVLFLGRTLFAAEGVHPVLITLRPNVDVTNSMVSLSDIAEVRTDSPELHKRLAALDLIVLKNAGDEEVISARQVRVRLLLDGVSGSSIAMAGSAETKVRWSAVAEKPAAPVIAHDEILRENAVNQLATAWLVSPEDVEVQLLVRGELGEGLPPETTPDLELPTRLEPGKLSARIRWMKDGRLQRVEQLTMEVRLRQTVLLAAASVPRGDVFSTERVIEEERFLSKRIVSPALEEIVGRQSRRSLNQGEIIVTRDVAEQRNENTAVIAPRDSVKVTLRKGGLTVVLQAAEALQNGRIGDVIRVRNLETNQILTAKVIAPREVEMVLR